MRALYKMSDAALDEHRISGRQVYDGNLLKVYCDEARLANGDVRPRELIRHPGAVGILAQQDDGSIILVKQHRYALGTVIYEIPAGKLDHGPDEDPLACAKRELSEETGYEAAEWEYLTSIVTTPGFSDEVIHLYRARSLTLHAQHTDEDEFINVESVPLPEVRRMVLEGKIYDAKSLSALCVYFFRELA